MENVKHSMTGREILLIIIFIILCLMLLYSTAHVMLIKHEYTKLMNSYKALDTEFRYYKNCVPVETKKLIEKLEYYECLTDTIIIQLDSATGTMRGILDELQTQEQLIRMRRNH